MNTTMKRRLEALERIGGNHGSSNPARIHEVMANNGIEAPEPLPSESTRTWLKRLPTVSIDTVMSLRGAHA